MSSFRIDFRWVEIHYELWALGEHLGAIERQLNTIGTQESERIYHDLRERGFDSDEAEVDLARQELNELVDHVIPRYFRSPFLVALWAVYESAIIEAASHLQKEKKKPLQVRDIKGKNTLDSIRKYYEHVLEFPLFDSKQSADRIEMLLTLRNAIAHGNGRKEAVNPEYWKRIEIWHRANMGIQLIRDEYVTFSHPFLKETYHIVNTSLHDLLDRISGFK